MSTRIIRCIVAELDHKDEPNLLGVRIRCTEEQQENGDHCAEAERLCSKHGGDPMLVFDENNYSGSSMLGLFDWDKVDIVDITQRS